MSRLKLYLLTSLLMILTSCGINKVKTTHTQNWNGGYCTDCGGELMYVSTGSKNHYICEVCGKEYVFDKINEKKKE